MVGRNSANGDALKSVTSTWRFARRGRLTRTRFTFVLPSLSFFHKMPAQNAAAGGQAAAAQQDGGNNKMMGIARTIAIFIASQAGEHHARFEPHC